MAGGYETQEADVRQVNPMTEGFMNFLTGPNGIFNMGQQFMGQGAGALGNWTPESAARSFLGASPYLQNLTQGALDPWIGSRMGLAGEQANLNRQQIEQRYTSEGAGNLFSSGFGQAVGQGMAQPYAQAVSDIGQAGVGLTGGLFSGLMGLAGQQMGGMSSMMQTGAGLYGQGMGAYAGAASPEFFQDPLVYQPGFMDYLLQTVGAAAPIVGAAIMPKPA